MERTDADGLWLSEDGIAWQLVEPSEQYLANAPGEQPEPELPNLAEAIAAIRFQASRLSPTGATAMALNATADALEALI